MGFGSGAQVSTWIKIGGSTTINYQVFGDGNVEFSLDDGEVDLVTTEDGLSILVDRAQEASARSGRRRPARTGIARRRDPHSTGDGP